MRHGVLLPPLLADMFDSIERAGKRGIAPEVLAWIFFPNKPEKAGRKNVYVNIKRLNDMFVSTDLTIRMNGRFSTYCVVQNK